MSLDPKAVSQQKLGSLQSCLVEGDPEQRARERRVRRKSLTISVLLQASVLAMVVLVPLFAKPERLLTTIATPIPPYRHAIGDTQRTQRPHGDVRHVCVTCFNSRPTNPDANNRVESTKLDQPIQDPGLGEISAAPCPSCINVPVAGPQRPAIAEPVRQRPRTVHTQLDPAMLIHRVEPIYPVLPKQLGRGGRVELRAVIATDGTIQSLQVVSGDPLFYQSALEAVRQWRYRPTVLNGEPVEIDTFITVIYNMSR
jgi:periplasmic protein TonB